MSTVASLLAAIAASLVPMVWFETYKQSRFLSNQVSYTATLLVVLPGTTGAVLLLVPFAPVVQWSVPDLLDFGLVLAASPLLWGVAIVLGIISKLTGKVIQTADINPWESDGSETSGETRQPSPLVLIPLGAAVGGAEELLFRGVVFAWLVDGLGIAIGLVLNGVLFGLYHYPNSVDSPREIDSDAVEEMAVSGVGGVLLGGLYFVTGNLIVPIAGHALHNTGLFYLLYARGDTRQTSVSDAS
jgi:membrane protease YdiL (CAAX protease family)